MRSVDLPTRVKSTLNNAHTFWDAESAERGSIEISLPLFHINGSCVFATRLEYRVKLRSDLGAAHRLPHRNRYSLLNQNPPSSQCENYQVRAPRF